ncbi:hypothetical protein HMPREF0872_03910 [Veillonella montpellierensis DNF00314]|uniref:Uncharacterized protein n=1 Tax=Veillonella montpellierensis DNF00314 TaxID=1401067 RepID=A0A096ALM1_9FIRM|nr:hypothetical protein [Veillonella montpellierensis]KGF47551.1 hypothetical protein HMPREF0872_03910 [Veillonella montpellierensis DNF00314]
MLHYFTIDYGNTGTFYNVIIDGGTREQSETYLQKQSRNVMYLKSLDETRKYKHCKDLGFGKLFHCQFTGKIPKGVEKDTRLTLLDER